MRALLLPLAGDQYAIELAAVREVVVAPEVTRLPGAPAGVLGVFNLRGEVMPLLDTAALLGLAAAEPSHVVVTDTRAGPAALTATGVPRSATLGDAAGPADLPGTIARFAIQGGVATLLDVPGMIDRLHP